MPTHWAHLDPPNLTVVELWSDLQDLLSPAEAVHDHPHVESDFLKGLLRPIRAQAVMFVGLQKPLDSGLEDVNGPQIPRGLQD